MIYIACVYLQESHYFCCGSLLLVLVLVSITCRPMYVHIVFSSVKVVQCPSFGKELPARLTLCALCIIDFGWTHRGLTSGFLQLWLTVLVFSAMIPLHC